MAMGRRNERSYRYLYRELSTATREKRGRKNLKEEEEAAISGGRRREGERGLREEEERRGKREPGLKWCCSCFL